MKPRVLISYSHDSSTHVRKVCQLANRLRAGGVDVHLDQYEVSPPQGWPTWMVQMISDCDFVIVICTETYNRRLSGRETAGVGKGARWEGALISQELYENDSQNERFIPVILSSDAIAHIPVFLKSATYYDLSTADGYENLYRHLTNQPRVIKPPLGAIVKMPAENIPNRALSSTTIPYPDLFLIMSPEEPAIFVQAEKVQAAELIHVHLRTDLAAQSTQLAAISRSNDQLGIAFGTTAFLVRVKSAEQLLESGKEDWTFTFGIEGTDYSGGIMEIAYVSCQRTYSPEELATKRARLILLNEKPHIYNGIDDFDRATFLSFVQGISMPIRVEKSPFPELYARFGKHERFFLAACRLISTCYLRLSGVVESIEKLDLCIEKGKLKVDFIGNRVKKYVNEPAYMINIQGTCCLSEPDTV